MSVKSGIRDGLEAAMLHLQKMLRRELVLQGHKLTGNLSESIGFEMVEVPYGWKATMSADDYGVFIEFGVTSAKIPYRSGSGRRGAGGKSKYIQGLIRFFELRGLPEREAIGAAFATAHVHQREGMPTRESYRFSRTGQRTGFVQTVVTDNLEIIGGILAGRVGAEIQLQLANIVKLDPMVIRA